MKNQTTKVEAKVIVLRIKQARLKKAEVKVKRTKKTKAKKTEMMIQRSRGKKVVIKKAGCRDDQRRYSTSRKT